MRVSILCYNTHIDNKKGLMYAIVNTTTRITLFFNTFNQASEACRAYNVLPGHNVYIINFAESQIEQL